MTMDCRRFVQSLIRTAMLFVTALAPLEGSRAQSPNPERRAVAPANSLSSTQSSDPASRRLPPAELGAFVDGVLTDAMRADHIAGAAVTVVQGGRVVLLRGYGAASLHPLTRVDPERTVFRIASISKTFTWLTALKAVEDGRLRMDAPINAALSPRLRLPSTGERAVTLADLMAHRGGFEDREFGRLFVDDPARLTPMDELLTGDRPRQVRAPGTLPAYSNYGAALVGAAVANLRGQDFPTLVDREIIGPLGMASTTFREPYPPRAGFPQPMAAGIAARLSTGFHWNGMHFVPQKFEYAAQLAPAASASTTAADMGRYMRALLAGGTLDGARIYGPVTAAALRSPLPPPTPGAAAWYHGFRSYALPGGYAGVGHNGVTMSFLSNMVLVPSLDLGIFVTTNTETGRALIERLPALIVGRFYAPDALQPKPADPATAADAGRYVGTYFSTRHPYGGLGEFSYRLGNLNTVVVRQDGTLILSGRLGSTAFVRDHSVPLPIDRFVARDGAERIVFAGQGRADRLYNASGGEVLERVGLLHRPGMLLATSLFALAAALALLVSLRGTRGVAPAWLRGAALIAGVSYLMALAFFQHWAASATDSLVLEFTWPGVLPFASAAMWISALAALTLLAGTVTAGVSHHLPRGRRRLWSLAAVLLLVQAAVLALWGGMTFWIF